MRKVETLRLLLREPMGEDSAVLSSLWLNEMVRAFLGGVITKGQALEKIELLLLIGRIEILVCGLFLIKRLPK